MDVPMNEDFKYILDQVISLNTMRNRMGELISLISLVTMEEHQARKYERDMKTYEWISDSLAGVDDKPLDYVLSCSSVTENLVTQLEIGIDKTVREVVSIFVETVNETVTGSNSTMVEILKAKKNGTPCLLVFHNKMRGVIEVVAPEGSPILYAKIDALTSPDVTPLGYDSWIGAGGGANNMYNHLIIYETAFRVADGIGAHNAGTLAKIAQRARNHVRLENNIA